MQVRVCAGVCMTVLACMGLLRTEACVQGIGVFVEVQAMAWCSLASEGMF